MLVGAPDWRDRYEDAARQPWIYALSSDHLVSADRVEFVDATTDPVGDVPYVIYETRTDASFDPPEGLELTVRGDQLRIFESLGTDERPSTFNDSGASDVMLLLDRSDLDPESRKRLDTDLHLTAAFTVDVTRDVEFLGPFAADIESELDAARELAGRQKQSEYDFLIELASVREDDRDPRTGRFTSGVLAEIEAEQERHRDPFHVWEQTPPDQRGIDPEVTPPHIMEKMQQARVFVQVDGRWPEGTALRILTDEGVALQVALQGFSDGYDIAVPPGSDLAGADPRRGHERARRPTGSRERHTVGGGRSGDGDCHPRASRRLDDQPRRVRSASRRRVGRLPRASLSRTGWSGSGSVGLAALPAGPARTDRRATRLAATSRSPRHA